MKTNLFSREFNIHLALVITLLIHPYKGSSQSSPSDIRGPESPGGIDSLSTEGRKKTAIYFGLGGALTLPGGAFAMELSIVSPAMWGGSLNYKATFFKSENIPVDYMEERLFKIIPKDYIDIVSICLVRNFPTKSSDSRFGIEAGPSFVSLDEAKFTISPHYDPNRPTSPLNQKWDKSHVRSNALGITLLGKAELIPSNLIGIKLSIFTDINPLHSQVGFGCSILFGYLAR